MLRDLRFALRSLARRPAFLATAVLTCALGVGASATLFSVTDGVLLRPFPYRDAERLAILWHEFGQGAQNLPAVHPLDVRDYRTRTRLFEEMTLAAGREEILGGQDSPEAVDVGAVEAGFFPFLGVEPALGRQFRAEEDVYGGPAVMILSHGLWARRFGADPSVIGRKVELSGTPHEIVGVLPADFHLLLPAEAFRLKDAEVWRPVQVDYAHLPPRNYTGYTAFGRVRPGVSFAAAQEEMSGIAAQIRAEQPVHAASNLRVAVVPLHEDVVKGARRPLLLLLGAVGLVLLIACANVALLLLTRGHARTRELLVRLSVGASRFGLARLVLAEGLVIAGLGAAVGLALAQGGLALVTALAPQGVPRLEAASIDGAALAFAALVSLLAASVFAIAPAVAASRTDVATGLRESGAAGGSARQRRLHDLLMAGQLALSVVLVVGAALLVRTFGAMANARPGFEPDGAVAMDVTLPRGLFADAAGARAFHSDLMARLRGLSSVRAVGSVSLLPFSGRGPLQPFAYDAETARRWESVSADQMNVSPGYFDAIGAVLVAGRDFTPDDSGRRVIVIDDSLARRAFGGEAAAVGERLQLEPEGSAESFSEVIGVVAHLRLHDVTRPLLPQIYFPQQWTRFGLVVRGPASAAGDVQRELERIDRGIAVEGVRPLRAVVAGATGPTRLAMSLMTAFGAIALLLAAVGIYGVVSFAVGQRTREIAVRLALGARRGSIRRLVLGGTFRVVCASLLVGAMAAALLARAGRALLYAVDPLDPATYAAAAAFLGLVALSAASLPAERASRVEPLTALRQD
ncbi:MAG TPA: ABC transporter permease [Vicinamibacteria bacterium]|nr:ABC transporter permease [Vicinamibacteria bacterium]